MARSRRRLGEKIPGVSTRMICALLSITMPRISARVVWTFRETIVTLEPTSAFTRVDLPTLGAPISATKPQRVSRAAWPEVSSVIAAATDAFARDHHRCRDLFGGTLAAADSFGRLQPRQIHRDSKLRVMVRSGPLHFAIDRCWQSFSLRPFLEHRLGIAQRPTRLAHPLGPVALDKLRCRGVTAVEKNRTDHRLADVAEHGFAQARTGAGAHSTEFYVIDQPKRLRDIGATLAAHQIGKPLRQLTFVRFRKRAVEHVRHDQTENVITQELETLITVAALTSGFKRRDVGEGGHQELGIGKFVSNPRLDRGNGCLRADLGSLLPAFGGHATALRRWTCVVGRRRCLGIRRFVVHRTMLNMR